MATATDARRALPVCDKFIPAAGGANKWCDMCGWRWDFHDDLAGKAWAQRQGLTQEVAR